MYTYEIRSYDDIYSIAQWFLTIKEIGHKYYSKIVSIYVPPRAKRIMS